MTDALARGEQRIAAKRPRGPGRPFEKGDARINRHGVPKESLTFQRYLRKALAKELQRPSSSNAEMSRFQRMVERLVELAERGVPWALQTVLDRIGGKPVQPIAGEGPQEVKVRVISIGEAGLTRLRRKDNKGETEE